MSGVCASCDEPTDDDDESLCASCLASPEEQAAHGIVAGTLAVKVEIAELYRASRSALRLARIYIREMQTVDARARACLNEVTRARAQIRALRGHDEAPVTSERPGLKKAQPAPAVPGRLRAIR